MYNYEWKMSGKLWGKESWTYVSFLIKDEEFWCCVNFWVFVQENRVEFLEEKNNTEWVLTHKLYATSKLIFLCQALKHATMTFVKEGRYSGTVY